jgi:hypothetical protein
MATATKPSTARLIVDLATTMTPLKLARTIGDTTEARIAERRLNWLIDKLPREQPC